MSNPEEINAIRYCQAVLDPCALFFTENETYTVSTKIAASRVMRVLQQALDVGKNNKYFDHVITSNWVRTFTSSSAGKSYQEYLTDVLSARPDVVKPEVDITRSYAASSDLETGFLTLESAFSEPWLIEWRAYVDNGPESNWSSSVEAATRYVADGIWVTSDEPFNWLLSGFFEGEQIRTFLGDLATGDFQQFVACTKQFIAAYNDLTPNSKFKRAEVHRDYMDFMLDKGFDDEVKVSLGLQIWRHAFDYSLYWRDLGHDERRPDYSSRDDRTEPLFALLFSWSRDVLSSHEDGGSIGSFARFCIVRVLEFIDGEKESRRNDLWGLGIYALTGVSGAAELGVRAAHEAMQEARPRYARGAT